MVLEFREDPTKNEVVVVANERARRPEVMGRGLCPFCKGEEQNTPPATFVYPSEENWTVRAFPNLFAAFKTEGVFREKKYGEEFWRSYAYGSHEVIVESGEHGRLFQELDDKELDAVRRAYQNRLRELGKEEKARYVFLFKNHGRAAGASIEHEHSQVISLPLVPDLILKEVGANEDYRKKHGNCLYCDLLEREAENTLFETGKFVALCPSFSRFPFETWILPKEHGSDLKEMDEKTANEFMKLLQQCIRAIYDVSKDYNIVYHAPPEGTDLHFHAEIYPRPNVWAGVELGTGLIINTKTEKESLAVLKRTNRYGVEED